MADRRDTKPDSTPEQDRRGREISGPGAADFLAAQGGLDRPESEQSKGTRQAQDPGMISDARQLVPNLDPAGEPAEKKWESEISRQEAEARRRETGGFKKTET